MEKTTVYLTRDQKAALERAARADGRSEARLIRDGIEAVTALHRAGEAQAELDPSAAPSGERVAVDARRPRWLAREEFAARVLAHMADAALRSELRAMAPDTTADVAIR